MSPEALAWALAQASDSVWYKLAQSYVAGVLSVRFADGRQVTYQSATEMARIIVSGFGANQAPLNRRPVTTIARAGGGWQ